MRSFAKRLSWTAKDRGMVRCGYRRSREAPPWELSRLDPGILRQAIERGSIVKWMYEARPRVGEMYLVEAGTTHSVGAGLLLLEVQQPSTSTYRIFDWGRTGEDGEHRERHLDEACGAVRFNAFSLPQPKRQTVDGPGWTLNTSMMGSVLPEGGLRVVIAEPGDCRIVTDLGAYDMSVAMSWLRKRTTALFELHGVLVYGQQNLLKVRPLLLDDLALYVCLSPMLENDVIYETG